MVTIYGCKHLSWQSNKSVSLYKFVADEVSDLPTTEETIIELIGENHILSQGSLAWIVADSTPYMYDPENGWVEQTNKTVMSMFDEFT